MLLFLEYVPAVVMYFAKSVINTRTEAKIMSRSGRIFALYYSIFIIFIHLVKNIPFTCGKNIPTKKGLAFAGPFSFYLRLPRARRVFRYI